MRDEIKLLPITVSHWKSKFDKSIRVLLQSGIKGDDLIKEIKILENEKNNPDNRSTIFKSY